MTYAALIEDQSRTAATPTPDAQSRSRRQTDKTKATKSGRRWADHVEIEVVGSGEDVTSDTTFVTTAFAAQVLGQFTNRPSTPAKVTHEGRLYQLNQSMITTAPSANLDRVVA